MNDRVPPWWWMLPVAIYFEIVCRHQRYEVHEEYGSRPVSKFWLVGLGNGLMTTGLTNA